MVSNVISLDDGDFGSNPRSRSNSCVFWLPLVSSETQLTTFLLEEVVVADLLLNHLAAYGASSVH